MISITSTVWLIVGFSLSSSDMDSLNALIDIHLLIISLKKHPIGMGWIANSSP